MSCDRLTNSTVSTTALLSDEIKALLKDPSDLVRPRKRVAKTRRQVFDQVRTRLAYLRPCG